MRRLILIGTTDAEICQLRGLTELEVLIIEKTVGLSDAGIQSLSSLKNLKFLNLEGRITDKGLYHLSGLRNLEHLDLLCTNFSNDSKPITGEGLKHLRGMTNLSELGLGSDAIGDEGLSNLEGLNKLEMLTLSDPHLTDAFLPTLAKFPRLTWICLDVDKFTPEAIDSFEKSHPGVQISSFLPYMIPFQVKVSRKYRFTLRLLTLMLILLAIATWLGWVAEKIGRHRLASATKKIRLVVPSF